MRKRSGARLEVVVAIQDVFPTTIRSTYFTSASSSRSQQTLFCPNFAKWISH
jgi:hypothetical protein